MGISAVIISIAPVILVSTIRANNEWAERFLWLVVTNALQIVVLIINLHFTSIRFDQI